MKVAILGGSGFIGREILKGVVEEGIIAIAISRNPRSVYHYLAGRVEVTEGDILSSPSMEKVLKKVEAVINCVGIIREDKERTFENIHFQGVVNVIHAMSTNGISRLIHISACGAGRNIPTRYFRSKELGEEVIRNSGVDYTIIRPSIVIGKEGGLFYELKKVSRFLPLIVLPDMREGKVQPVKVSDLVKFVVKSLKEKLTGIYEIGGPTKMSMEDVVMNILSVLKRRRMILRVSRDFALPVLRKLSPFNGFLPMTYEEYRMAIEDTSPSENALEKFGISMEGAFNL